MLELEIINTKRLEKSERIRNRVYKDRNRRTVKTPFYCSPPAILTQTVQVLVMNFLAYETSQLLLDKLAFIKYFSTFFPY